MTIKEQIKKIELQIVDCEDELKLVEFERTIGMKVARTRKFAELEERETASRSKISQLLQLIEEIKKQGDDEL